MSSPGNGPKATELLIFFLALKNEISLDIGQPFDVSEVFLANILSTFLGRATALMISLFKPHSQLSQERATLLSILPCGFERMNRMAVLERQGLNQ